MANKFDSRRTDQVRNWDYWNARADYGLCENLRDSRYQNIGSPTSQTEGQNPILPPTLGQLCESNFGLFRYVNVPSGASLVEGNVVTYAAATTVTNITSGAADFSEVTKTGSGWTVNQFVGFYCYVGSGSGSNVGFERRIIGNSSDTLLFEDPFPAAWNTADDLIIYDQSRVIIRPASATAICAGVAISAITSGNSGFIQVKGHCNAVLLDANAVVGTNNLLVGSPSVAGAARESAAAATTDDERWLGWGLQTSVASQRIPADIQFVCN